MAEDFTTIGSVNYANTYCDSLAEAWAGNLYFEALFNTPNNGRYRWSDGKTIQIPSINTSGRVSADRDSIDTAIRNYDNTWETKILSNHRKWSTLIHPLDINQTNHAVNIANITSNFNKYRKFPEMDAYCISSLYTKWVGYEMEADTTALTVANILTVFDSLMQNMTEKRVPLKGRILYVTPATMTLLKNAEALSHTVDVQTTGSSYNRTVSSLDGVEVQVVPAEFMKTAYTFTEGWMIAANAKQIHMFLVHPEAVITPISYQFAQLDPPSAMTEGKYYYFEESCEDVFILAGKVDALQFVISA